VSKCVSISRSIVSELQSNVGGVGMKAEQDASWSECQNEDVMPQGKRHGFNLLMMCPRSRNHVSLISETESDGKWSSRIRVGAEILGSERFQSQENRLEMVLVNYKLRSSYSF
jgi:hypothetical protein